jgi:hypothetical protein
MGRARLAYGWRHACWPLQNDWMANNKADLKNSAAYVHSGIHLIALSFVFGWVAVPLAFSHLLIDTRTPVVWWSMLIKQTQPTGSRTPFVDIGIEVRFWTDQVFHIMCVAVAALVIG